MKKPANTALKHGRGALEICHEVEPAVGTEADDVVEWFAVTLSTVHEKTQPVVAGCCFHHTLSDAGDAATGEAPVHPKNVVAVRPEATGGRSMCCCVGLLFEGSCSIQNQRKSQTPPRCHFADLRDSGVGGQTKRAVHRINERGKEALFPRWFHRLHAMNRRSSRTFSGLSWWVGLKAAGTAHCRRIDSGPNTRGM